MILHLPATRAAEDFARALDGTAGPEATERYAPLVATATLLREQPAPAPRPEFVAELRAQLMAAADTALVPGPRLVSTSPQAPRRRVRERHLGAAAAAAVLVATTAGVAAAAEGSLPGDTLYPVKRGIEQVQVAMNNNDAAKGAEYLRLAGARLAEVEGLLESGGTTEEIDSTLQAYGEQANEGSRLMFRAFQANDDPDDIVAVREFTTSQVRQVEEIASLAPPTSTSDFGAVAGLLGDIDQQARVLCSGCSGAAAVAAPAALVEPGGVDTMGELVAAPIEHAILTLRQVLPDGLGDDAKLAEHTARNTPKAPASNGTDASKAAPAPNRGTTAPDTGSAPTSQPTKPLTDLVTTVTSSLDLPETTKRITRPLEEITKPVTDGVTDLLEGLGGLSGGN